MRILLMLVSIGQVFGQDTAPLCRVSMRAVDVGGRPVSYRMESFTNARGVDYSDQFRGLRGNVPCDVQLYSFRVVRSNVSASIERHTRITGRVNVSAPESWLTVSTDPNLFISADGTQAGTASWALPVGYSWRGHIRQASGERLWVYLRSAIPSVYGLALLEAEVDSEGNFRFYSGIYKGPYLLYVMDDEGQVRYIAPLNVAERAPIEPLEIALPAQPLATVTIQ